MPLPPVRWRRFVRLISNGTIDLVELAVDGSTFHLRQRNGITRSEAAALDDGRGHGEHGAPARSWEVGSPEAAVEAMARDVPRLRGEGYYEEGVRLGPPPEPSESRQDDRELEAPWRQTSLATARAFFEDGLPRFCDAWLALGHDPRLSFHEAVKRQLVAVTSVHDWHRAADDLADQCIHLAEGTFGISFTRRTTTFDEEHGTRQSIGRAWLANFYGSPVGVLVVARCKLQDESKRDDDEDAPGLADELVAWLDARLGPLPPAPVLAPPSPEASPGAPPAAKPPPRPRQSKGDPVLAEAILAHVRRRIGPADDPYPDDDAHWVKLDVLLLRPAAPGGLLVFCTTGMAERPLPSAAARAWTELEMRLPAGSPDAASEPPARLPGKRKARTLPPWPVAWLQQLARRPHQEGAGYQAGAIVALAPPAGASPVEGALLLPSDLLPDLPLVGRTVTFLTVCPLHASEIAWGRDHGAEALTEAFRARGVDPRVLDPGRGPVA